MEKLQNYNGAKRYYKKYLKICAVVENYKEVSLRLKELSHKKCCINHLKLV